MRMKGLLRFSDTGRFHFRAFVNDGIRFYINDRLVLDEPQWNSKGDRYTSSTAVQVDRAGWYPVTVEFFQRKGTATIKLYWKIPGDADYKIIPAEAYAHLKQDE
jgi:hypothetical protein